MRNSGEKTRLLGLGIWVGAWLLAHQQPLAAAIMSEGVPNPAYANLSIWLNAGAGISTSGGLVTQWADQSTNGRNVTGEVNRRPAFVASESAINNQPVVNFGADTDDVLRNTNAPGIFSGAAGTIFAFVYAPAPATSDFVVETSGDRRLLLQRANERGTEMFTETTTASFIGTDAGGVNSWQLWTAVLNGTNSRLDITNPFLNTTVTATGALSSPMGPSGSIFAIGGRADNATGNNWSGKMAEVLIYNEALTDLQRAEVQDYLVVKYVPEPASVSLLAGAGLAAAAAVARRRVRG